MDITQSTMIELRDAIAAKQVTAHEVTEAYLQRIAALNDSLGAYTQVFAERALQRADEVDAGKVTGALAGVPIAIKDNLCTTFGRTTCSSKILEKFESPYDATAVRRLEAAGAVILGKTNLDEFAMGSSTENSAFAPTRNPWDTTRVPGGSSGGSAAAVAAGLCAAALGSDTGGSIRQPAALCGIVGLKPTYGLVSRLGLVAYASSLDQIGPMTRSVSDAALLLDVIAGHDPLDSTSADDDARGEGVDYLDTLGQPVDKLRIGLAKQYISDANDPQVNAAIDAAVAQLREFGAEIVEVDLPHTEYGIATYYIVATAEASSNLARFDGVHYGHRTDKPEDLIDLYAASRAEGFGDEVKRRIMLGTYTLSSGYYDAYYLRALKVRRLIKQDFDQAFTQCDAILCPPTTHPAFAFGDKTDNPLAMYLNDVYTVNCNLAGIPGLAIPAGFADVDDHRLPIGLQLLGPTFSEARLFQIAAALIGDQPAPLADYRLPG
ncbi:Asp-tRNA(Asn)/Glu-tRNA(Gln) amidotransferase subunit GatA [Planctomycetales bacterium ZRK34]|nr:Asp-tRNA(Asn)/Glu-tRNA(Gln) amidotransferase subunit GatA [Planctomycetales bacterium ZRK34]